LINKITIVVVLPNKRENYSLIKDVC